MSQDADIVVREAPVPRAGPGKGSPTVPSTAGARPRRRRPPWVAIALVAGFGIQVAWRLWLSRNLIAPAAHADEDAYLVAARAIAGGPGGGTTENAAFRRLGYPMLISPVYWFTSDAFAVYRGVHIVNALVNALTFPLAYAFGRRVLAMPRRTALGAGFVVAGLPAVAFYAEFALTDAVLAPVGLAWLLLAHRWLGAALGPSGRERVSARLRLAAALGAGAFAGLSYAVHVRGTIVVVTHVILAVSLWLLRRSPLRLSAASVAAAAAAAGLDPALKLAIRGTISIWGRDPRAETVDAFTTLSGAGRMLAGAVGQLWYLGVGTLGLGAVALVAVLAAIAPMVRRTPRRRLLGDRTASGRALVLAAALTATVGIALTSSAALPAADLRATYFAYPRYIHFLFPVWFLVGLAALGAASTRRATRLTVAGAGVTIATGGVVALRLQSMGDAVQSPFDGPETAFLGWSWQTLDVTRSTACALALLVLLVVAIRWSDRTLLAALTCLVVLNGAAMHVITQRVSEPLVAPQYLADTPRLVRDVHLGPGDRVAVSNRQSTWYVLFNAAREVYWTRITVFNHTTEAPPADANVVIAPWRSTQPGLDWDGTSYGFHRVAEDRTHQWAVWRRGPAPSAPG